MSKLLYRLFRFSHVAGRSLTKRLTPRGIILLGSLVAAALIGLDTNQTLSSQIFTFLTAILGLAIAASQLFRFRFWAKRSLPRFGTVGQPLRYKVQIQNQTRQQQAGLQLFEEVVEAAYPSFQAFQNQRQQSRGYRRWFESVAQGRRAITKPVDLPILPPNRPTEVTVELMPLQRGLLRLTGIAIARPDPLGLVQARRTIALPQSILILPQLYQVPPLALPGLQRYQSGGVALSSAVGDAQEFRALREYRQGDSPRKIHWKSWAKVGKPVVKEEQDEYFVRHALILDTFIEPTKGDRLASQRFEAAVSVAASFACEVKTQESLLDLMFVGLETYCFTVGRSLGQTDRMLEILAAVVPCQTQSFQALIPAVMERISLLSGCICIFLTWDAARKSLIQRLEQMQIPTLVLLICSGQVKNVDSESELPPNVHILQLGQIQSGLMRL